jgi:hypothetical protein
MKALIKRPRLRSSEARGFVLPVVVFGLVLLSMIAVAALLTASDESKSSRAMSLGAAAFYAAEAGFQETYARWSEIAPIVDTLSPGGYVELPWQEVLGGARYQATVFRWDNGGGRPLLELVVKGRGRERNSGQRVLRYSLTTLSGEGGRGYSIGGCCRAAVTVRGTGKVEQGAGVNGYDEHPHKWAKDECSDTLFDKPGIVIDDENQLVFEDRGWADGQPPVTPDPSLDDSDFDNFGVLSWDELKDMADHYIGITDDDDFEIKKDDVYPRYMRDPLTGEWTCDTSHPYNWGSPNPRDPCYNYFPIIVVRGGVKLFDIYGQGLFILDWDESLPEGMKGSEMDLEKNVVLNGLILGKGCVEVEENAEFHGAIFVDGFYRNEEACGSDDDFAMNDGRAEAHWSQCAVDRTIVNAGLEEYAEVEHQAGDSKPYLIHQRAFAEMFR